MAGFSTAGERPESGEVGFGELPVHEVAQEGLDELGAQVAVVDVVGMLPHVDAGQGLVAGGQRGAGGAHVDDVDGTVGLLDQPGPAGTEVADGGSLEGSLELVEGTPLGVDGVSQCAGGSAAAVRLEGAPE